MKFETWEYTVGEHFLSAIINGDYSGLNDNEVEELNGWLLGVEIGSGHWSTVDDSRGEFTMCDVTRRYSICETLHWMQRVEA